MESVERTNSTISDSSDDGEHYQSEENLKLFSPEAEGELRKCYMIDGIFGWGTFGVVVRCWDYPKKTSQVAVKLTPLKQEYTARTEAEFLFKFKDHEDGYKYVIQVTDFFIYKERACLVMETMEMSLNHYIYKATDSKYLDLEAIKRILHDVLMGLAQLQQMSIIHADMKPDNVMLNGCGDVQTLRAKIIDFGLAHFSHEQVNELSIQTREYRSPEVIMYCLPYCEAIDVWSTGCILGEMLLKRTMYPGINEYDQLRYIIENQGPPPQEMIKQGWRSSLFFTKANENDDSQLVLMSPEEFQAIIAYSADNHEEISRNARDPRNRGGFPITTESIMPTGMDNETMRAERRKRLEAYELMQLMLKWDPEERITAEMAVKHQFFQQENMEPFEGDWKENEVNKLETTTLEGVDFASLSKSSSPVHILTMDKTRQ